MDDKKTDSGFVEKISGEYYNLTAAEKRAADFILSHRTQCQHIYHRAGGSKQCRGGHAFPLCPTAEV